MIRALAAAAALAAAPALAQLIQEQALELEDETLRYTVRRHAPDAHLLAPGDRLAPTSALNAAKLLHRHLVEGDIEAAALLSNSPKRRYEVYREFRASIGEDEFKRVFGQYFFPENRLLAEIAIGRHRLLIWRLRENEHLAGQYYVETEGRFMMDDVPSAERSRLRRVLEAYRSGKADN